MFHLVSGTRFQFLPECIRERRPQIAVRMEIAMGDKVWFITGCSRGFGRVWTEAALGRGDRVAATARTLGSLADLKEKYGYQVQTLELDVTRPQQAKGAVAQAHAHFGRLDVVINNVGYPLIATIEEASAAEVRALYETNILGTIFVLQAALPLLREQGGGHILGISSTLGHVTMPLIGFYASSKWAFEAIHESLATEVKPFGSKVTLVEPGAYATEFGSPLSAQSAPGMDIYADLRARVFAGMQSMERGDPRATPDAMFKLVDAEDPPLRLFLGNQNLPAVRAAYADRLATWEAWQSVSESAQGTAKR